MLFLNYIFLIEVFLEQVITDRVCFAEHQHLTYFWRLETLDCCAILWWKLGITSHCRSLFTELAEATDTQGKFKSSR